MPNTITVTPLTHPEAVALIVYSEVTSRRVYEAKYARPTWPRGDSGVTIGIGWDCGYNSRADLDREWPALDAATRARLYPVMGAKGQAAKALCDALTGVVVPWEAAYATFRDATLPRFERQTADAFPGSIDIPPPCFGALVSLVFNRGPGMIDRADDAQQRRREMRAIRDLIAGGRLDEVPAQFRAMKRLWAGVGGLLTRRDAEAAMWERGLTAN